MSVSSSLLFCLLLLRGPVSPLLHRHRTAHWQQPGMRTNMPASWGASQGRPPLLQQDEAIVTGLGLKAALSESARRHGPLAGP